MTKSAKSAKGQETAGREPGIEETFEALEEMVKKLEDGENTLEESFACYEQGMKLVKTLNAQIDKVEKQIDLIGVIQGVSRLQRVGRVPLQLKD